MTGDLFADQPHQPSDRQVVDELLRELATRRRVYPSWIEAGRIEQHVADHRIRCLEIATDMLAGALGVRAQCRDCGAEAPFHDSTCPQLAPPAHADAPGVVEAYRRAKGGE